MIANQNTTSQRPLNPGQLQQLRAALTEGRDVETLASEFGLESGDHVWQATAAAMGLQLADLSSEEIDLQILEQFPLRLIHRYEVFPLRIVDEQLLLAISDPFDLQAIDAISSATGLRVMAVLTPAKDLSALIKSHLGVGAETIDGLLAQQREQAGVEMLDELSFDGSEDAEMAQEASVVRLVNEILSEAIETRASDIHIESQETGLKIRYRIDGVLQRQPVPTEMHQFRNAIISRLKIMAKLNIAEKRVPQDGRIKLRVHRREVDVRVSIIPMLHGEGVVMRVLDKDNLSFSLRGIGMSEAIYQSFSKLIRLPHGIVLVTGPTGSGKTTTLYSALSEIQDEETKIITTEDPIEYQLEGINQIQVHTKVGLSFAASLRAILRHDPDVVLVGEIRDLETAENATQASLTGHMVFSTLHTNDSASAFMRLCDMGVEPFLVSSTVEGVVAQRLVRQLCPDCRAPYVPQRDEVPDDFPWEICEPGSLYQPQGCRECRNTGYRGRSGLYELLVNNEEIQQLCNQRAPSTEIKRAAIRAGMQSLRHDGWQKVADGITSIDEVVRVTKADALSAPVDSEGTSPSPGLTALRPDAA